MWGLFLLLLLKPRDSQANHSKLATQPGTLAKMLLPGFSKTLREHNKLFCSPSYTVRTDTPRVGWRVMVLEEMTSPFFLHKRIWWVCCPKSKTPLFSLMIWPPRTTHSSKACFLFGTKWYKSCVILYHSPWSHCYAQSVGVNTWAPLIFLSLGSCTQLLWGWAHTTAPFSGELPALLFA